MSKIQQIINNKQHYGGLTLAQRMSECHTPAISIAIVENCEISELYTLGEKRRGRKEYVTADTLFQSGSISKPVFAAAVVLLAQDGVLDLDADVQEYLVGYDVPTLDGQKHKITLRQLLCHNAGLNLHGFYGYRQGQKLPATGQILDGAGPANSLKLKLVKAPESGYQYSGGGYVLAQKVVEDVCGSDFCSLMDKLVLAPFSMPRSTYAQPLPKNRHGEIAVGYNSYNLQIPGGFNSYPELSAAGLWSTPEELARFGIEIMKAHNGESRFPSRETARLMTTQAYENSPYGLGLKLNTCKKGATFGHGGDNIGYHANMVFCPADGSGMVIMLNSDIGSGIRAEVTEAFTEVFGW